MRALRLLINYYELGCWRGRCEFSLKFCKFDYYDTSIGIVGFEAQGIEQRKKNSHGWTGYTG